MTKDLRGRDGRLIGRIADDGNSLRIKNRDGKYLGYYNKKTDQTHDRDGRLVGYGNLLTTLIE